MQAEMNARAQQQARWLLWQMGGVTVDGAHEEKRPADPPPMRMPEMPRSRYNAVVRRMQQAGQHTGTYTAWT